MMFRVNLQRGATHSIFLVFISSLPNLSIIRDESFFFKGGGPIHPKFLANVIYSIPTSLRLK